MSLTAILAVVANSLMAIGLLEPPLHHAAVLMITIIPARVPLWAIPLTALITQLASPFVNEQIKWWFFGRRGY